MRTYLYSSWTSFRAEWNIYRRFFKRAWQRLSDGIWSLNDKVKNTGYIENAQLVLLFVRHFHCLPWVRPGNGKRAQKVFRLREMLSKCRENEAAASKKHKAALGVYNQSLAAQNRLRWRVLDPKRREADLRKFKAKADRYAKEFEEKSQVAKYFGYTDKELYIQ
jgi:hypothetical protein